MREFQLKPSTDGSEPFIELNKLIKLLRISENGAQANQFVEDGIVKLNGQIESRKRAKLRNGDVVEIFDQKIVIVQ
ncbi:MAG: RNA-binding S4 domain-containing protein [Salinivirgaceae bacterium]|jgi:ribosome-associated protein|nr:RNA-binding S4 domain-containing protein [Salinivirgaceae bacterium]